jgi:hypothetical protein
MSSTRKIIVHSNVLGAAAWNGNTEVLMYALDLCSDSNFIDKRAAETLDFIEVEKKQFASSYTPEFQNFTPLMLAVSS